MSHKEEHPLDVRKASSASIRAKHPDRIPVIVEKRQRDASLPEIDKKKFLVPSDLTVGQFVYVIRKRIKLAPEQAIFLFVSAGTLPPTVAPLQTVRRCTAPPRRRRARRAPRTLLRRRASRTPTPHTPPAARPRRCTTSTKTRTASFT